MALELRIASLNIWALPFDIAPNSQERIKRVAAEMKKLSKSENGLDVLAVQVRFYSLSESP